MSPIVVILLAIVVVVLVVIVLVRFGPTTLDLVGLNQEERAAQRVAADEEDMRQMRELADRDPSGP
jgi:hypothetical protein